MKRLSFFKVYGRVDVMEQSRRIQIWLNSGFDNESFWALSDWLHGTSFQRMTFFEPLPPTPLPVNWPEPTLEQLREREEYNFKTLSNRPREAVTQDRIDKAFGVDQDDKLARKESLRAHAWVVRNNLTNKGKSTKEVEEFIKSLGLE